MLSVSLIPPELPNLFPYKLIIINQQWNLLFASSGRKTMKSNTKFWERDQNGTERWEPGNADPALLQSVLPPRH
jgi:hypothetical protein